jgi:hypothetical protein
VYCHAQKNHTITLWVFIFFYRDILELTEKNTIFLYVSKKTHRKIRQPQGYLSF